MKKNRQSKKFLDELRETPIVSVVCKKLNISRNSVYRWCKEDSEFEKEFKECLLMGSDNVSDLAESKLISHINSGEPWAIKYWLSNRKREFMTPRKPIDNFFAKIDEDSKKIEKITVEFVDFSEKNDNKKN